MAPKRGPAELGVVANESGAYRAAVYLSRNVYGPRRGSQKRAFEDLLIIRAAAAEHTTRMGALQAMQLAAARLKESAVAEAGGIVAIDGEYRARIKYTDNGGLPKEIKTPRRSNESRPQADLERIRSAGAGYSAAGVPAVALPAPCLSLLPHGVCDTVSRPRVMLKTCCCPAPCVLAAAPSAPA